MVIVKRVFDEAGATVSSMADVDVAHGHGMTSVVVAAGVAWLAQKTTFAISNHRITI
jgi:hypothetical protein